MTRAVASRSLTRRSVSVAAIAATCTLIVGLVPASALAASPGYAASTVVFPAGQPAAAIDSDSSTGMLWAATTDSAGGDRLYGVSAGEIAGGAVTSTGLSLDDVRPGESPYRVLADESHHRVFVLGTLGTIQEFDTTTPDAPVHVRDVLLPETDSYIDFALDESRGLLYTASLKDESGQDQETLFRADVSNASSVSVASTSFHSNTVPRALSVDENLGRVFITSLRDVSTVDESPLQESSASVVLATQGLTVQSAYDEAAHTLYIAQPAVLDNGTKSMLTTFAGSTNSAGAGFTVTSPDLDRVGIDSAAGKLYFAGGNRMHVVDASSHVVLYSKVISGTAAGLTLDTQSHTGFVLDSDGAVTVISSTMSSEPTVNDSLTVPTITGKPAVGAKLAASKGTWALDTGTVTYRWYRSTTAISGATASTYTATTSDYGKKLSVVVSVKDGSVSQGAASSALTIAIGKGAAIAATKKPAITGTASAGKTITVSNGTWPQKISKYTYKWLRSGTAISGATKPSYKVTSKDKGKKISVVVTVTPTYFAVSSATTTTVSVRK